MIRDILTRWGFQIDDKKLGDLDSKLEGIKRRMDLLVGVQVVKGLFSIAEQFSKVGEEIAMASEAAGISAEEFQKLAFAAKLNNVEVGEMQQGLKVLSKQLYEARNGSKTAVEAFKKVGITQEQIRGFGTSKDALVALANQFQSIEDPIKKSAVAQELLGKGGSRLTALLSKGGAGIEAYGKEAEKLGVILSSSQVAALDKLENGLQKVYIIFKSISALVAAAFAPTMIYLIELFQKFLVQNRELIQTNIISFVKEIAYAMGFLFGLVEGLVIQFLKLAKAFGFGGNIGKLAAQFVILAPILFGLRGLLFALIPPTLAFLAPWLPWFAGIALALVGLRDIWALINGKPTWIGQGFNAAKSALGFGVPAGNTGGPTAALARPAGAGSVSIEAPMTFHVPEGTPMTEVGRTVKNAAVEHFEQVMRNTVRSTAPTVAY